MVHVPYRGQPSALTDLLGGQVQVDFATMPPSIEYIKDGRLRALAVKTAKRSEALPDLPTVGEFVGCHQQTISRDLDWPTTPRGTIDPQRRFRALANLGGHSDQNLSASKVR